MEKTVCLNWFFERIKPANAKENMKGMPDPENNRTATNKPKMTFATRMFLFEVSTVTRIHSKAVITTANVASP